MQIFREPTGPGLRDYSGIAILVSNGLVIFFAMREGWNLQEMIAIYWMQSVIIGFFHFFRMLLLRSFCTEGFTSNGTRVAENAAGKWSTAIFFAVHYGIFHLVYGIFLLGFVVSGAEVEGEAAGFKPGNEGPLGMNWFAFSVLTFFIGHAYSFYQNVRADRERRPNLGMMMFFPYVRILPMHLTILLGLQAEAKVYSLLLFLSLKTVADYVMHLVEHRLMRKKTKEGES